MDANRFLPLRILNGPRSGRWPWLAWAAAWALTALGAALYAASYTIPLGPHWGPRGVLAFGALMITPMGAVVASRQPQNAIGWLYCSTGLLCAVQFLAEEYAVFALLAEPGWLPGGAWAAWLQNWIWVPAAALYLIFVPLLLPEGRLPSPRWRPVVWFGASATTLLSVVLAAQPGRLANFNAVINPLGISPPPALWLQFQNIAFGLLDLAVLAVITSLIWRVRHANATQRQQLKWLALALAMGGCGLLITGVVPGLAAPVLLTAIAAMHAATGLAILRHRLYDLDVVVNRAAVYALLTAALAGLYLGFVVVLQSVALALTGQQRSELVTVLSTLAIAALFNPLRGRIQRLIDRRFFRRKYDAEKALARFGRAVRDDSSADLERLNADLIQVVDEALEPAAISLWVRPTSPKHSP